MTTISGIIEAITYADDASGFAILQMKPEEGDGLDLNKYGRLGLKGSLAHFCVGDRLKVEGRIENHATYGPQVFVQEVQVLEPQSVAGIKGFLSGRVDLIGDVLAQVIVDKFGMDTLRILDESPERLTEVPGIGEGRAKSIIASWRENTCLRDLIVFMGTVGLPTRFATEIVDKLDATESEKSQKQLIEQIKADPYMLCRLIHGIGWKIADAAAMKMGIPVLSSERIRAAAHYQLGEVAASAGHCFLYTTELVQAVVDTIDHFDMQHDRVEAIIEDAVELKILKKEDNRISLPRMHTIETTVARRLQQIMAFPAPGKITSQSESLIEKALASSGLELAEQQKQAVRMAMTNKVSVLTGGPGTGKTTVLKTVVAGFQSSGLPITLLAPTGRAARRMGDVIGMQAVTIHKRLHSKKGIPPDPLEGIVVVDEISMVDIALMHRLLTNALDDTIFLFVGDKDQLPSVSPGAVLRDLLSCGTVATTTLTEVFRQAAESDIVVNAHSINRGGLTKPNEWSMSKPEVHSDFVTCYAYEPEQHIDTLRWWITQYCPANGIDPLRDVQVMIPQKTGQVGVHAINAFMQRTLNPNPNSFINRPGDVVWGVGDRLMNLKNNYDLDIYNGDIGTLVDVVWEDNEVAGAVIDFDGQRIEVPKSWFGCITLAYAMTIHKCVSLDTLVETDRGLIEIGHASTGEVATPHGHGTYTRTPNNRPSRMLTITTQDGYRVTVTPDHGMDVWNGQDYVRTEAGDIRNGDLLRVRLSVGIEPARDVILPSTQEGDVRESKWVIPSTMTPDLAEWMGLMVADGCCFPSGFRLAKRHCEVVDRFSSLCHSLFGYQPKRWTKDNISFAEVCSTHIRRWVAGIGGMEPCGKGVPACVMQSSSGIHAAFLKGLFEDAGVNLRSSDHNVVDHIDFSTAHERIAEVAQVMLARLGIVSNHTRDVGEHKYSHLYVYGAFANLFADRVGFVSHEKQRRARLRAGNMSRYSVPVSDVECQDLKPVPGFSPLDVNNAKTRNRISRAKAKHLAASGLAWCQERLSFHHGLVATIDETVAESTCLSVPDGHRFMQNGISGWNSQGSEYPFVIMLLHTSHHTLLQRNIVYTAVTRARQQVVAVVHPQALAIALRSVNAQERNTYLAERLQGEPALVTA